MEEIVRGSSPMCFAPHRWFSSLQGGDKRGKESAELEEEEGQKEGEKDVGQNRNLGQAVARTDRLRRQV
jgi:hypothetical protein